MWLADRAPPVCHRGGATCYLWEALLRQRPCPGSVRVLSALALTFARGPRQERAICGRGRPSQPAPFRQRRGEVRSAQRRAGRRGTGHSLAARQGPVDNDRAGKRMPGPAHRGTCYRRAWARATRLSAQDTPAMVLAPIAMFTSCIPGVTSPAAKTPWTEVCWSLPTVT